MTNKMVVLLNDTMDVYHWGCYGTSHAIREQLRRKGIAHIVPLSVNVIHRLTPVPQSLAEFSTKENFIAHFPPLAKALALCDYVVVNGEGTLHDFKNGPRALLYIMYAAKTWFNKRVYLINHACYPGSQQPEVIDFYKAAYHCCDFVAARESTSQKIIENLLGKPCTRAFDSLPLSILPLCNSLPGNLFKSQYICLSGAVNYDPARSPYIARGLLAKYPGYRFIYLVGSYKEGMNREEPAVFHHLKQYLPTLELYDAKIFANFLSVIQHAELLVSGRYHYFIAALCLATRQIYFPSNTLKIDAVAWDLGLPLAVKTQPAFEQALKNIETAPCVNYLQPLCQLALNNYGWDES